MKEQTDTKYAGTEAHSWKDRYKKQSQPNYTGDDVFRGVWFLVEKEGPELYMKTIARLGKNVSIHNSKWILCDEMPEVHKVYQAKSNQSDQQPHSKW